VNAPVKFSPGQAAAMRSRTGEDPGEGSTGEAVSGREGGGVALLDPRSQDLTTIPALGDVVVDVDLERALVGSAALRDAARVSYIKKLVRNTHAHWRDAAATYLKIGMELLAAFEHLGQDYERLVEGRLLPFSRSIETQLRAVARAVKQNRLPPDGLPGYSVAYKLSLLPDPLLERAKAEGLVRPNVTRREVEEYRAKVTRAAEAQTGQAPDTLTLARRRDDLLRRRARLQGEIDTITAHLADIDSQLRRRGVSLGE
jgi:hypothetical protein